MQVTPWLYNEAQLTINTENLDKIAMDLYEENGEWDIVGTEIKITTRLDSY